MKPGMRCEYISWPRFYRLCAVLCDRLQADGYRPDAIIGVARGGYPAARVLADFFGVMNLAAMKIEHYRGVRKSRRAVITHPLPEGFTGSRILLVDDVSDSGDTFETAMAHLDARGLSRRVRTAVLHHKETSRYLPDFSATRVRAWRWIMYPWAVAEDLASLLPALDPSPASPEEAAARLREAHGLVLPPSVIGPVLSCMGGLGSTNR